jgi:predicted PurR-regulated permease PerM
LEIKYFYALAVFSGLATSCPSSLGPIMAVILAGVIAAFDSWGKLIGAFGGALAGVVGALVVVPTAALIDVFLDEYRARSADGLRTSGNAGSTR